MKRVEITDNAPAKETWSRDDILTATWDKASAPRGAVHGAQLSLYVSAEASMTPLFDAYRRLHYIPQCKTTITAQLLASRPEVCGS